MGPNSSQGRGKVGVPPALLARPAGLENVSVPREQTFEQAAALCPAVCGAAIHPAGELETAQDARTPPYPASKADRRALQSPALEALWVKSGYFPPVRGFPTSLGSLPPPRTSREPWSRVGFIPPCRAAAGVRALGSAAWASPDAEPHAEGLPTSCRVVQDMQQPCASRQPGSPIRTDPLVIASPSGIRPLPTMLSSCLQHGSSLMSVVNGQNSSQLHTDSVVFLFRQCRRRIC